MTRLSITDRTGRPPNINKENEMKYTLIDVIAWTLNGFVVGLMIWFMHSTYSTATQMGYTPAARAHMDELVAAYQEPDWDEVPRLSIRDLE